MAPTPGPPDPGRPTGGNAGPNGGSPPRAPGADGDRGLVEYPSGTAFPGVIGRTTDVSSPAWPRPARAATGSPNVVVVVLDDTGFGQLGCYGSPIATPNIDALAGAGLRYANLRTTALCSPSRACIMTGRNHHANATAAVNEIATGYPGYNGHIPFENGFLSEMLLAEGYNTYMVGKWHLVPSAYESAAGPYDRWPLGRGFERFYGFLGGDTNQWYPDLVYDNHRVEPPRSPEEGYHLTADLADRAIDFVADAKQVAPTKPFLLYLCPGATHAPHHVPREWADRYRGAFDGGWEAYRDQVVARQRDLGLVPAHTSLSRHDPDVPAWADLPAEHRRLYARMMEVFAGFLTHTDHHLGRVLDFLASIGEADNTLVMLVSDNGASPEGGVSGTSNELQFFNNAAEPVAETLAKIDELGGPTTFNHYPWGWTWAGNTPFRRWKRETYRGGVNGPCIVTWPRGIAARGEVRTQYAHLIDLVPTVLDALGLDPPERLRGVTQSPLHGVSFAHTFDDPGAPSRHRTQYFEMLGHRALDHDGWRAVCPWPGPSFAEADQPFGAPISAQALSDLDAFCWELYHLDKDPAENHNLAGTHPTKLIEMITRWYAEAGRYDVLPIDGSGPARIVAERPQVAEPRSVYTFWPHTATVPAFAGPRVLNRPHAITAEVDLPPDGAEGTLICQGSGVGGWAFYVQDRRLHYAHNYVGRQLHRVSSTALVPPGAHRLRAELTPTGSPDLLQGKGSPARVSLYVDTDLVGEGDLDPTVPVVIWAGGLTCGANPGLPVDPAYHAPFRFTGTLHRVTLELGGEAWTDTEAELRADLAHQ